MLVLLAYGNTLHSTGFALDNESIILNDHRIRTFDFGNAADRTLTIKNLNLILTQDYWFPTANSGLWRPLTTFTYMVNYAIFKNGAVATGYHWVNLFLHWINAVLAFCCVRLLVKRLWPAFFAAAIFAVHPVSTEAVTNIVGRADLLATLSVIAGLLFHIRSTEATGAGKVPWLAGLMVATTLGLLCKESGVVIVAAILLYDLMFRVKKTDGDRLTNLAKDLWRFFREGYYALLPPLLAFWPMWPREGLLRGLLFQKAHAMELPFLDNPLVSAGFWSAKLTAIKVFGKYLWLLAFPYRLSCDYSYNQVPVVDANFLLWENAQALVALAVVVGLLWCAARAFSRNRALSFSIVFFFVALLPTSNLFVLAGSIMSERFLYLPSLGFAAALVLTFEAMLNPSFLPGRALPAPVGRAATVFLVVLGGLVCLYLIRTASRNRDWESNLTLFTSDARVSPNSFKTHALLARALYRSDPSPGNIDRVIAEAEKSLAITNRSKYVLQSLGVYYYLKGNALDKRLQDDQSRLTQESRPHYLRSVDLLYRAAALDRQDNQENRAKERLVLGRSDGEIYDIGNHQLYLALGVSLVSLGRMEEALRAFEYRRHLAPDDPDSHLKTGSVYRALGRREDAAVAFLQAVALDRGNQDALGALRDLYAGIAGGACAFLYQGGNLRLNSACAPVHDQLCAANSNLVQALGEAGLAEVVNRVVLMAIAVDRCSPDLFPSTRVDQATFGR